MDAVAIPPGVPAAFFGKKNRPTPTLYLEKIPKMKIREVIKDAKAGKISKLQIVA